MLRNLLRSGVRMTGDLPRGPVPAVNSMLYTRPVLASNFNSLSAMSKSISTSAISLANLSESERVHGKIDPSQVTSKAMRKQLERQQQDEFDRTRAVSNLPPPPPPPVQPIQPQEHYQYQQPTFGQMWMGNMVSGFSVALGVIVVFGLLRAIGLEGNSKRTGAASMNSNSELEDGRGTGSGLRAPEGQGNGLGTLAGSRRGISI